MSTITYDNHSFMIDGKRIWIVSGSINYTRVPRELWRDRIRSAKQAGLNCIDTYVFWNVHEPQPESYKWDGEANLREFIQLVHEEGMWCIIRPGPFIGGEWDFGGMPAWLLENDGIGLRHSEHDFMQHCARYLAQVMEQIEDLQITADNPGPVILIQNEHEWFCHNEEQADGYLFQLNRYLHEAGCDVPIINSNNLWQHVPETVDCWVGWNHLLADCRQLRIAQPDAPRFVSELWTGWFDTWGRDHDDSKSPDDLLRALIEVSAAGCMFNLYPFHGGTNFAFHGGRTLGGPDGHITTSYDYDAPLAEGGGRGPKYANVRRFCTFLNQFSTLMAHLRPHEHHATAATDLKIIQQSGPQGEIVFIIRDPDHKEPNVDLLTPDGQEFQVHLGDDPAAWLVMHANIGGLARLDLTNLRPWAVINRRLLVMFGPAGTEGIVSINGGISFPMVPSGSEPLIETYRDITLVVLNESQIDAAYFDDHQLFVGASGIDGDGQPIPHPDFPQILTIQPDGRIDTTKSAKPSKRVTNPKLGSWSYAAQAEYVDGSAPRFAQLNGPQSLESCGADFGYGWYKIRLNRKKSEKIKLLIPEAGDRLHLYQDGKAQGLIGVGPGAEFQPIDVSLSSGESDLMFLVENQGRYHESLRFGESKGIYGDLLAVKPVKPDTPVITQGEQPADPFEVSPFVPYCQWGDQTPRPHVTWKVKAKANKSLVLVFTGVRPRSVVSVNGQPIRIDSANNSLLQMVLRHDEHLQAGTNEITLGLIDMLSVDDDYDPASNLTIYEVHEVVTSEAEWWYARWEQPASNAFGDAPRSAAGQPGWFKSEFEVSHTDQPLWLEIAGATKGQIYLNGHNVGRYFVATQSGEYVPPQSRYYLPEPWLKAGKTNELVLFEEHGKAPSKSKLIYSNLGPYGD